MLYDDDSSNVSDGSFLDLDDYSYCDNDDIVSYYGEFSSTPKIEVNKYGVIKYLDY